MTRIKRKLTVGPMGKIPFGLIFAIALTISIHTKVQTITFVSAFSSSAISAHSHTKSFLQTNSKQNRFRLSPSLALNSKRICDDNFDRDVEPQIAFEAFPKEKAIKPNHSSNHFQRKLAGFFLALTIATTTIGVGFPIAAHAGFGPSSGATTTPPPNLKSITNTARKISADSSSSGNNDFINIDLDGKKLKILIDSTLNPQRFEEFTGQLDTLIDDLKDSVSALTSEADGDYGSRRDAARVEREEREKRLLKAQNIRLQIERQEKRLKKLENEPYWFNYFAAFVGSAVSTLIMHPLDTIKTRLQVSGDDDDEGNDSNEKVNGLKPWKQLQKPSFEQQLTKPKAGVAVLGMTAAATPATTKETIATNALENLGDLYEGITGNLFKEVPPSAVYLGVYETVKYALSPKVPPEYLLLVYLIAGGVGETVGSIIRAPAEAVKSLVQSKAKDNALEAAQSVLGTPEGRANVFRAWSASIGRDVPFGAIQLAVFELIKAAILNDPNIEIDSSTLLSEAVIGAFAGGVGAFVTTPTDVITTRIITQDTSGSEGEAPLGVVDMGKKIYSEEGVEAFFAGWKARVGYWAPAISIFLTCYCTVRRAGITYDLFP